MWVRESLTIWRDPFSLIFSLLQPLIFLALFGPLLSGIAGEGDLGTSSLQWFLPGVVVMITMFGTSMVGVQPAVRAHDRGVRADPGHPAVPARRCWSAVRSRSSRPW